MAARTHYPFIQPKLDVSTIYTYLLFLCSVTSST
jgi:hypothetical protein